MLNAASKLNLVLKHGKKFALRRQSRPVLRGIHYASDGTVYVTNSYCALRVKNAHGYSESQTIDAWTGGTIVDEFPNLERLFPTTFDSSFQLSTYDAIQDTAQRIKWAHVITKALKTENRRVSLEYDDGSAYLTLDDDTVHLKSLLLANIEVAPFKIGLNAEYLYHTLKLFEDAGTRQFQIKLAGNERSPVTFEDVRNEIAVIILPVIDRHAS